MATRTPDAGDTANALDVPCILDDAPESFMVTMRTLRVVQGLKIIWWYVAIIDQGACETKGLDEEGVETVLHSYAEADRLLF
jgi:hypothetical protein